MHALALLLLLGCGATGTVPAPAGAADLDADVLDADAGPLDGSSEIDAAPACPYEGDLQAATDAELARQGIPSVTLGIDMPGCTWVGAAGVADREKPAAIMPTDGFRIASITKTFTAAVTLQLVEEGLLELSDPIADYVAFPDGDSIAIRHLLTHTSGIYDYYNSPSVQAALDVPWTREEVIDVARAQPLAFAPGSDQQYSNTNYFLLGMIIETVTGHDYDAEVRDRLLDPLGLHDTYVAGEESPRGSLARGYDHGSGTFEDVTDFVDPSLTWAAGGIVSTTPDLMVWTRALIVGDVLGEEMRVAMLTPEPLPGGQVAAHGLGVAIQDLPAGLGRFVSHLGRLEGYYGMIGYLVDHDTVTVQLTNDQDGAPNPFMTEMWMVVGLL